MICREEENVAMTSLPTAADPSILTIHLYFHLSLCPQTPPVTSNCCSGQFTTVHHYLSFFHSANLLYWTPSSSRRVATQTQTQTVEYFFQTKLGKNGKERPVKKKKKEKNAINDHRCRKGKHQTVVVVIAPVSLCPPYRPYRRRGGKGKSKGHDTAATAAAQNARVK